MSKRAENSALEAYPPTYTTVKRYAKRVKSELVDTHKPVRALFQHGYEQAEKDLMKELEEKIKKVSEAGTWNGILVDEYLNEIRGGLTWRDIRRIVKIADDLLDDPKARVAFQNHNEEYYYRKVLEQYNNSGDEANSED